MKIVNMSPSSFSTEFNKKLNAKYTITSSPQRVATLIHDLHDFKRNKEAQDYLEKQPHEKIFTSSKSGQLRLYDTAVVFMTNDNDLPIAFIYTFKHVMFDGKPAIQEDKIECFDHVKDVRIEGLPLSAYSLFKVLLPRFKVVIGGDQHTPQGECWSKRQIKEATAQGLHVYLRNDNGDLYNADTYDVVEMNKDYLWGIDNAHRKRLTIITLAPL